MSNDESKKPFNKKLQLMKTSFQFRSIEVTEVDELSSAFNNILYKVRIERYIDQLKSLLNNPPAFKPIDCDIEAYYDQVDNYLWMVGEIISGLYEIGQLCEQASD